MNREKPGDSVLVQALRGGRPSRVPLWFMRQAGRYLPEYHEIRKQYDFMQLCRDVDAATRISLQPYERFRTDGIIMFQDILTPLWAGGVDLHFEEGRGPVINSRFEGAADLTLLDAYRTEQTVFVADLIKNLVAIAAKEEERPAVLGFAGAPFTLASYLIEGGSTRTFAKTKTTLFGQPDFYHEMAGRLATMTVEYLRQQISAGVDAVQLFDSWGGILSREHYSLFARPYTEKVIAELKRDTDVPIILFVGNGAHLVREMAGQSPTALSLDWRTSPDDAPVPPHMAVQGNLDPLVLYGSPTRAGAETRAVLERWSEHAGGYVFNLGHGIHPKTPIACVEAMIDTVRRYRSL